MGLIDTSQEDREANYFAMCLLVPEELLRREVSEMKRRHEQIDLCEDKTLKRLADKFKVSNTVMALRLEQVFPMSKP